MGSLCGDNFSESGATARPAAPIQRSETTRVATALGVRQIPPPILAVPETADSGEAAHLLRDDAAQGFRDDPARRSGMMPPIGEGASAGWRFVTLERIPLGSVHEGPPAIAGTLLERLLAGYARMLWWDRRQAYRFALALLAVKGQRGRLSDLTSSSSTVIRLRDRHSAPSPATSTHPDLEMRPATWSTNTMSTFTESVIPTRA
jgi:hypothetical protein